jgi:putative SOS response-associated peptidase YedK
LAPEEVQRAARVQSFKDKDKYAPCYNAGPTKYQPVMVWQTDANGGRTLVAMKWGLVPVWSKSSTPHTCPVNARAEAIHEKNTFRRLVDTRRCVVLASGYFEWKRSGPSQGPYFFSPQIETSSKEEVKSDRKGETATSSHSEQGEGVLAPTPFPSEHPLLRMAGLWDTWHNQETGEVLHSFTVITVFASQLTSTIHDRMPALLWNEEDVDLWLNPTNPYAKVKHLLEPSEHLTIWPVSEIVGNVKNDVPECIKPVDRQKEQKKLITSWFKPKPKQEPKSSPSLSTNSSFSSQATLPHSWATEDLNESGIDEFGLPLPIKMEETEETLDLEPRTQYAKRTASPPLSQPEAKLSKR